MYTSSKKFPYKNALLLLGSKSLEQLANHEDKLLSNTFGNMKHNTSHGYP